MNSPINSLEHLKIGLYYELATNKKRCKLMTYSVQSGRQDCLRCARRSFSPPCYPRSLAPTSSGRFCFVVRFCEQVRNAPEQNKTRSYRCGLLVSRDDKIRTCDPLHPMQVRYRAALRPETGISWGAKVREKKAESA
jgi:hypothetical protein